MKSLPARLLIAVSLAGTGASMAHARSYSFESLNCLFQIAKPVRAESMLAFSFLPLTESLALHSPRLSPKSVQTDPQPAADSAEAVAVDLNATWTPAPEVIESHPKDPMEAWPVFDALHKLRDNPNVNGLSHTFTNPNSYLALDYSDIFETGRAPYKGGHGVSFLFRHDF